MSELNLPTMPHGYRLAMPMERITTEFMVLGKYFNYETWILLNSIIGANVLGEQVRDRLFCCPCTPTELTLPFTEFLQITP
jgi:hypothetical protein